MSSEVESALADAADSVRVMAERVELIASRFRSHQVKDANEDLARLTIELRQFVLLLATLRGPLAVAPEQLTVDCLSMDEQVRRLAGWIEALITAQGSQDWIAIADVLELDMEPALRAWSTRLLDGQPGDVTAEEQRVSQCPRVFSRDELVTEYRRLELVAAEHGDRPGRATTLGWDLEFLTPGSLLMFVDYILFRGMNDYLTDRESPVILDCGANVGLTVLNYKRLHPDARITAFEPDPRFVPVLRRNLERNGAGDVRVVESAVWTSTGRMPWVSAGTDGSRLVAGPPAAGLGDVSTVDLLDCLDQDVDLLKIDIEGAEFDLVPHLAPRLGNVRNILVECHLVDQAAYLGLGRILATLQGAGFQISLNSYGPWRDLIRRHIPAPFHAEQYLLVAGWRVDVTGLSRQATSLPYMGIGLDRLRDELTRTHQQQVHDLSQMLVELASGEGASRVRVMNGPFRREGAHGWVWSCPPDVPPGDLSERQESPTVVIEDDRMLGPAYALHDDIRTQGGGRYSHWGSQLYWSTSDNSDPNTNGRTYRVVSRNRT